MQKRNREPPKSTSTAFDESILGPISRHKSKLARLRSPEEESAFRSNKSQVKGETKKLSTFEKMMLSFEQAGSPAETSSSCGTEMEEGPKRAKDTAFGGAQHTEWRNFTMEGPRSGSADQPTVAGKEVYY